MENNNQSINQSIWRIFIAPLKIKFHRGAYTGKFASIRGEQDSTAAICLYLLK